MSLGYAEKLSYREDIGKVGMPELYDTPHEVQSKIEELAKLIQQSRHLVVFTGAGISTSCGIPDFRGPKGIWTLQHEGKPLPRAEVAFHQAKPGLTHMALVGLQQAGILKFVISQNIDGLHLKSGIPRHLLSELHGNSFREVCSSCGKEFVRDFEVETIGLKETGRRCTSFKCRGKLKDTVLDWEDALPASELTPAENHCSEADVVLCLGTSLQITPACNLPLRSVRAGGKMVIVNLQATPKDKKASLLIRARVDEVIAGVLEILKIKIPPYLHIKYIVVRACFPCKKKNRRIKWSLRVGSVHGQKATLPFIKSVEISFPDRADMKSALLNQEPFVLQRDNLKFTTLDVHLKLELQEDTSTCSYVEIHQSYNVEEFKDDETNNERKAAIVENLRAEAIEGGIFGRALPIDSLQQRESKEIMVEYVFVTGITKYCMPFEEKKIPRISSENGSCDNEAMVKRPKLESTVIKECDNEAMMKKPKLESTAIKEDVDRSEDRANGSLEDLKNSIHLDPVVPQSV